jgi:hypothetical protein
MSPSAKGLQDVLLPDRKQAHPRASPLVRIELHAGMPFPRRGRFGDEEAGATVKKTKFRQSLAVVATAGSLLLGACGTADDGFTRSDRGRTARGYRDGGTSSGDNGGRIHDGGAEKTGPALTPGQVNALASAEDYLSLSGFSRSGLIEQLKFEGYSTRNATFAVDRLNVDWNEQAARSGENYLSLSGFSRSGLIEQLEFEGYTRAQAQYGANKALGAKNAGGAEGSGSGLTSGQKNALTSAESYLSMSGFSRSGLIEQLKFEGYDTTDATFAADHLKVDWNKQAARSAESYLSMSTFSRSGLVEQLEFEGYTRQQAEYGANSAL